MASIRVSQSRARVMSLRSNGATLGPKLRAVGGKPCGAHFLAGHGGSHHTQRIDTDCRLSGTAYDARSLGEVAHLAELRHNLINF